MEDVNCGEYHDDDVTMTPGDTISSIESSILWRLMVGDARTLSHVIRPESVDLVITSPPYPMISMWDAVFMDMDPQIGLPDHWGKKDGPSPMDVFERMHAQLDLVWSELFVVVRDGGIVALNIGDATRSVNRVFRMFPNGARAMMGMIKAGFVPLPNLYWKKPSMQFSYCPQSISNIVILSERAHCIPR